MIRRYILFLICYASSVLIKGQSVYMHEAQENSDNLDLGTFFYSLIIIIPIALIWYVISAYIKDQKLQKTREEIIARKQEEEERNVKYQSERKTFFDKLKCNNIVRRGEFDAVDLGLPSGLLWGAENIGAKNVLDYGSKYVWASTKELNSGNFYPEFGQNDLLTTKEEFETIKFDKDVVKKQRGLFWKTPSVEDYRELINECKWEFVNQYGIEGWKIIGANGNFIYIPLAYYTDMLLLTLSPNENEEEIVFTEVGKTKKAYFLELNRDSKKIIKANRTRCGFIRPVSYEINSMDANIDLGLCYLYGYGIEKNIKSALHYLEIASDHKEPKAQRILGELYLNGKQVDKNINYGIHLLEEAAKQDEIVALRILGYVYQSEAYSFKDIARAIEYFTKAGKLGDRDSILSIVKLFKNPEYIDFFDSEQYEAFEKGIISGLTEISQITGYWINKEGKTISDKVALYDSNHTRLVMSVYDKIETSTGEYLRFKTVESYKIKDGTRMICEEAFSDCHNLKSIEIPPSVSFIGKNAFQKCEMLHHIELPNSILYIGDGAFNFDGATFRNYDTNNPKSINIPPFVKIIDGNPFCYNTIINNQNPLFKVVDNVMYSADEKILISYCSSKEEFTVPRGVTRIGIGAFRNTPIRRIHFPETLQIIDKYAFYGTLRLESVEFPESLREIREEAFSWCTFKSGIVKLPWKLSFIDANAFDFDWHIKIVRVPKSRLEYYKQVLFESETEQIIDEEVVLDEGLYLNLQRDEVISTYDISKNIKIPEGVSKIWDNAFIGVHFIESITFPKTLQEFSSAMFDDCVTIEHINIPIGSKDFYSKKLSDFADIIQEN